MNNFAEAVSKAKQIAAQLALASGDKPFLDGYISDGAGDSSALKRHSDDSEQLLSNPSKRLTTDTNKLATAAAVAAQINQKLGRPAGPPRNPSSETSTYMAKLTENISIPEKLVGLVIGKGGEQITRLQEVSGAKIQIAPDNEGTSVRAVSICGTMAQVQHARRLIDEVSTKADRNNFDSGSLSGGQTFFEMKIPGNKVGLVIGKGGETIKALQEQCGVKMVMIQDSNAPSGMDKPLRITGLESGVARAREMVNELLSSKDNFSGGSGWNTQNGSRNYAQGGENKNPNSDQTTYAVPAERAGLVIGKGGETIKEICRISNAHVEIQKRTPPNPNIKIFNVSGSQTEIDHAIQLICEKAGLPTPTEGGSTDALNYTSGYGRDAGGQYGQAAWNNGNSAYSGHNNWGNGGAAVSGVNSTVMSAPSTNPMTGQADYSAAWAEYYRHQGMNEYAEAILAQARGATQPTEAAQQTAQIQQQQNIVPSGNSEQWQQQQQQWQQQWQQWQQQWAQQQGGQVPQQPQYQGNNWGPSAAGH